jgi:protein O-mannosyl-transferase
MNLSSPSPDTHRLTAADCADYFSADPMKSRAKAIGKRIATKAAAGKAAKGMASTEDCRSSRAWPLIIFVLACALYSNVTWHGYVMDDYGVLRDDFLVKRGVHGISTLIQRPYRYGTGNLADNLYRPLSQVMFAVEWELSPDNPALSHILNVLFYALSGALLFMIFRRILPGHTVFPALLASLLWLFHPVHTEAVANIKGRDEIMSAFFLFLSILSFLAYLKKTNLLYLAGAMTCSLFAFFSKESSIAFLCIFPIIGWYFVNASAKRNLWGSASLLIPAGIYLLARQAILARYAVPFAVTTADNFLVAAPDAATRTATAVLLLGKYLLLLVFPYRLVCDNSYNQIPLAGPASPLVWLSAAVYAAAIVYAAIHFREKSVTVFAILVYLVTISIVGNIFMLIGTSFAERLLFLPSTGFCLLAGVMIAKLAAKLFPAEHPTGRAGEFSARNRPAGLIVIIILTMFAARTVTRSAEWKDEWTLVSADVKRSPSSARMRFFHGIALRDRAKEQTDQDEYRDYMRQAIDEFEVCVAILPTYVEADEELGLAWHRMGNPDKALQYYERAMKLNSRKAATYSNMAIIFFERQDYARALELHKKAVSLDPNFENGYMNIGSIYGRQGDYQKAVDNFEKVIRINPTNAQAYYYLGVTYGALNQPEKSRQSFAAAATLDPSYRK